MNIYYKKLTHLEFLLANDILQSYYRCIHIYNTLVEFAANYSHE